VAYPLRLQGVRRSEATRRARAALDRVGLGGFADHYPDQLSGGMQQRVNLARALVVEPELLLLDEPFASVDAQMRQILQDEILSLLDHRSLSAVFVTHQIDEAVLVGDTIVIMSRGPGSRIRAVVDVPLSRPRSPEVRRSAEFQALVDQVWGDCARGDRGRVRPVADEPGRLMEKHLLLVFTRPVEGREEEFNAWYDG